MVYNRPLSLAKGYELMYRLRCRNKTKLRGMNEDVSNLFRAQYSFPGNVAGLVSGYIVALRLAMLARLNAKENIEWNYPQFCTWTTSAPEGTSFK